METPDLFVVGFAHAPAWARQAAQWLHCGFGRATVSTYPSHAMRLLCPLFSARRVFIVADVSELPDALFRLLVLGQGLRDLGAHHLTLISPWIAYGRQDRTMDRVAGAGIALGRTLAQAFDRIITLDAHSQAFINAFGDKLLNVLPEPLLSRQPYDLIVAPDHGATQRATYAAQMLKQPLIILQKIRTAHTVTTSIPSSVSIKPGMRALLVDDIGDSGRTLIAATETLKKAGVRTVNAVVTHAIDLSALRRATHGSLSSVQTVYDHKTMHLQRSSLHQLIRAIPF